MLLLNFVKTLIFLVGLIIVQAMSIAYGITGLGLVMIAGLVLFVVLTLCDVAETKLIEYFNPEGEGG